MSPQGSTDKGQTAPSAGGYIWSFKGFDENHATKLASDLKVSLNLARLLLMREISTKQAARAFLSPDPSLLIDPKNLSSLELALSRLDEAIKKGEKIVVFGDFDVDGITATALSVRVLRDFGGNVDFYIPSRFNEGYGLSEAALKRLKEGGASVILTVDTGISAFEEVERANGLGLDVIITDHHEPGETIPNAVAVINPKRDGKDHPLRDLAGVGVVFKLLSALAERLIPSGYDISDHLDLVALGTIADMVPLKGENRTLVKSGLKRLAKTDKLGLTALMESASLKSDDISAEDAAYFLAPRLNAAGRVADATKCVRLLLSNDAQESAELADRLKKRNEERRQIEEEIMHEAFEMAEGLDVDRNPVIVLASADWHEGVKGIVASRLMGRYSRPAFLLTLKDGLAVGSGRSIPAFNLFEALSGCGDILESFGGHAGAAGLKIKPERIDEFKERINEIAREALKDKDLTPKLEIDLKIDPSEIGLGLLSELEMLSPFGVGNPSPIFLLTSATLAGANFVGSDKRHLSFKVCAENKGDGPAQKSISVISFNHKEKFDESCQPAPLGADLVCRIVKNEWNGSILPRLQLIDFDARPPSGDPFLRDLFNKANESLIDDPYRNITDATSFYTKVVGVTFEGRQEVVAALRAGRDLYLIREPENAFDKAAIRVEDGKGGQIGFLRAAIAKHLSLAIDGGAVYKAKITEVTGGGEKNLGVNILVKKEEGQGSLAPKPVTPDSLGLKGLKEEELILNLADILLDGKDLLEKQKEALAALSRGENTLAIMGTGRGKSAIFHIFAAASAIRLGKITIIIYPLRSLINDQHNYLQEEFERIGITAVRLSGDIDLEEREAIFSALKAGAAHIVLTTPEFIHHNLERFAELKERVGFFVVDEAHHVSTSSELHRPLYSRLEGMTLKLGSPLTLALTATAADEVATEISKTLNIKRLIIDPFVRKNLILVDKRGVKNKDAYIKDFLLSVGDSQKSIIYVNSREQSIKIASFLRENLPELSDRIAYYNAGLDAQTRHEIESRFKSGQIMISVSTSAFGEGVNIPDISNIFLYHMPFSFIEYNQSSGRAGRDGKSAAIHLLFGEEDSKINRFILESMAPSKKSLTDLYIALKNLTSASIDGSIEANNRDILNEVETVGSTWLSENGVYGGLKIFEELGLVEIFGSRNTRTIRLKKQSTKVSLSDSVRFEEGSNEKDLFFVFKDSVLNSDEGGLLSMINQPIYPKGLI